MEVCQAHSRLRLFVTPWTIAHQAPLSMGFSMAWVAMPFSRGSSQPRNRTWSPALQADSLPYEPLGKPFKYENVS